MEYKDIRLSILQQIDNIDDLTKLCYTNKAYEHSCSQKIFWVDWYKRHHIQFPNNMHDNAQDWIDEYKHIVKIMDKTRNLLESLENNKNARLGFVYKKNHPSIEKFASMDNVYVTITYDGQYRLFGRSSTFIEMTFDYKEMFNFLYRVLDANITVRKYN